MAKPREVKNLRVDKTAPAYLVVEMFGGLTKFSEATGYSTSTVYDWLIKGLIPSTRFERILTCARREAIDLPPETFVPQMNDADGQ